MWLSGRRLLLGFVLLGVATVTARQEAIEAASPPAPSTTSSSTSSTTTSTSTTTTTLPRLFPLTGRPVGDATAAADRPAVSVKIDNISAARPQAGIDGADVVYEEFTEGVTRLIVVFHSDGAEVVGPVRSVRPADPTIVTPFGGALAFSGGSPAAVELARAAPLAVVTEGDTDVMYRRPGRFAPHNLYTSTDGILSKAPPEARAPPKLADFLRPGSPFTGAGAVPVARLSLAPAPYLAADYDWDGERWKRSTDGSPHLLEDDTQLAVSNVILQFTPYAVFEADANVQFPEVIGTGEAWVLAAGSMVKGTWSKSSPEEQTVFKDSAGAPIALQPGMTWVHLLAPGSFVAVT